VPSARKRQDGLLWAISRIEGGQVVGRQYAPPYTRDMRALVKRGLLRLSRRYDAGVGSNVLLLTKKGQRFVTQIEPDNETRRYLVNAFNSASLR
jgi:hypothetical protein